jgi:hypothetical protein
MSIPTIGEQRFQAQLLHALNEIADAIQENTKAVRAFTEVIQSTTMAAEPVSKTRRPAPPSPPPDEDDEFPIPPGPTGPL